MQSLAIHSMSDQLSDGFSGVCAALSCPLRPPKTPLQPAKVASIVDRSNVYGSVLPFGDVPHTAATLCKSVVFRLLIGRLLVSVSGPRKSIHTDTWITVQPCTSVSLSDRPT